MKTLGWEIIDAKKKKLAKLKAIVPKDDDAGALAYGANMSSYFSYDQASNHYKNDRELIQKYRDLSFMPEVDMAIEEIINEVVVTSENIPVVNLLLEHFPASDEFKEKLHTEFKYILNLLDFQNNAYDFVRRWYIDGRIFFHILIDTSNPKAGILDLRQLDSQTIKKIKEVEREYDENQIPVIKNVTEYFIYNESGNYQGTNSIRISSDSIAYSNSGIVDPKTGVVLSYLHKVLKVANQLSMIESAMIIYRLTRAPERKAFFVDTGDLPKAKAEAYLTEQITRHRNKMVYDPSTGEIVDKKNVLSMMEDYWIPRRGGTRATEIQNLEGGNNLSAMEDVQYFKEKLYKSLNVPITRLQPDSTVTYSKDSPIAREELKFSRFVDKLRKKFTIFLLDIFRKQLILKNIITPNDWNRIKGFIYIDFQRDSYYTEIKNAEIFSERLAIVNDANNYVGNLFSKEYLWKSILQFSDEQIDEMKTQMKNEAKKDDTPEESTDMNNQNFGGSDDMFGGGGDTPMDSGTGIDPTTEPLV